MMRKMVVLCVLVLAPALAGAAPRDAEKKARAHYGTAQGYFNAGDYEAAIVEFKAAYELSPRPRLLFNIGSAYRRWAQGTGSLDDKRQAVENYRRFLEAESTGKGATDARIYVAELEREIAALEAAKAQPVAPEAATVPVPEAATPASPAPAPAPVQDAVPETKSRAPYRIAGIATAGVGVALVGAGAIFGLKAKSAKDDLAALQAGGMWNQDKYDSGTAANRNMIIFLGVGAAAIATGAVLYFVIGHDEERPVAVLPGPGSVAVIGRF